MAFEDFVATIVQTAWRRARARRAFLASRRATIFIQAQFRAFARRREVRDEIARGSVFGRRSLFRRPSARDRAPRLTLDRPSPPRPPVARSEALRRRHASATRISRAWRGHVSRRAYRRVRDFVLARDWSHPADVLLGVTPEASLADEAAGTHVRLRLGGETFPPGVYYRIHTHRPVADVCAFAPRDYDAEARAGARRGGCARRLVLGARVGDEKKTAAAGLLSRRAAPYRREERALNAWRPLRRGARAGPIEESPRGEGEGFVSPRRRPARRRTRARDAPETPRPRWGTWASSHVRTIDARAARRRRERERAMRAAYGMTTDAPKTRVEDEPSAASEDELEGLLAWSAALDVDAVEWCA
jgi:hypothetical protein